MSTRHNALTDAGIKAAITSAKAGEQAVKIRKLFDGAGLYAWVYQDGRVYWRLRYYVGGKEKSMSMGTYPETGLAEARRKRDGGTIGTQRVEGARQLLQAGVDPAKERKAIKAAAKIAAANTFQVVANEWYGKQKHTWAESHATDVRRRLEANLYPSLGKRPISQIDAPELLDVLRRIERRGAHDLAHRVLGVCGQVFRYGVATGRCPRDVAADLRGALTPHVVEHQKAVDPMKELPALLKAIDSYDTIGDQQTRLALQLLMLTFVRTGELIGAAWDEFDIDDALWTIPGERMKNGLPHIVPLSSQALALLLELKAMYYGSDFVFPGRNAKKHISNNTLLYALYRLGYRGKQTGHGMRRIASTLLNGTSFDEHGNMIGIRRARSVKAQTGFPPDVIERQLAHVERNQTRGAYNMAAYLGDRTHMMQTWADYLDKVREEYKVVALQSSVA